MGWAIASWRKMRAFMGWYWNGRASGRTPWFRRVVAVVAFFLLPAPVLLLLVFRFLPIPGTPEMLARLVMFEPVHYEWREFDQISPHLARAVIGSEDQNFCSHNGFDWRSIAQAWRSHERHPRKMLRGASTISQQTARTLFLGPVRSWVRKGLEAYLTVLMEGLWPKKRILTAYLNLVDWGNGNFGAEAAARAYFGKSASALSASEAARLATVLPNPERWRVVKPGPYVASRTETVMDRSYEVVRDELDACLR
jgi:monofunctional biosynthetic peptidoglycan transglycosylase